MNELLPGIAKATVLVFLISSMSGIGLGLTLGQVVTPFRNIRIVLLAVLANFVIAPLLATGLSRLLRLEEPFAVGLLVLSLAAGAPFLPKVVALAGGDVAGSVGLMVLLMIGTTVFLPVALPVLVQGVEVNPWKLGRFIGLLMLLPLSIGLIIRARAPLIATRLQSVLEGISTISLLVALILITTIHFKSVLRIFGTGAIAAALLFAILSSLTGWVLGGPGSPQRTVFGLGTGLRNLPAALVVAVQNFEDPNVSVMIIVCTLVGIFVLVPAGRFLGEHRSAPLS